MATVFSVTGAVKSTVLKRTLNPNNNNELIISFGDIAIVVNKRAWNMLTINAPIERIMSTSEVT